MKSHKLNFICIVLCFLSFILLVRKYNNGNNNNEQSPLPQTFLTVKTTKEHERCQGEERKYCVPPFKKFEKRFRVSHLGYLLIVIITVLFQIAEKYKLNICSIEKNFSTILTAIACYLFNEEKYTSEKRNLNDDTYHRRLCKDVNEAFDFVELETKFNARLDDWMHIAPVREPIERFISGFLDKCLM